MKTTKTINVIGGGLAGSEAAWQAARRGVQVRLFEMRPARSTGAHRTGDLAELVCSNSLKSEQEHSAPRLLKDELRAGQSLLIDLARETSVPAGGALAVDRERFSALVTERLSQHPNIELCREEVTAIKPEEITVIAAGPLASAPLVEAVGKLTGEQDLYFFDAISPIVDGETINYDIAFKAARYGKGGDDYVNCPMSKEEYLRFYEALSTAETVKPHAGMENEEKFFEGCLPIEELARRGVDTLRFGPMKPVGLPDPRTGREAYACVQLRLENLMADAYNIVGFQCHIKYGEQKRVLQLIPGLENAEFIRFGQMHRNTYICSPRLLSETLQMRAHPNVLFAGQISGIEGYTEAMATGMIAGMNAARLAAGLEPAAPPRESAVGSLTFYLANADAKNFQPANTTFALLPPLEPQLRKQARRKADRHRIQVERGLKAFNDWLAEIGEANQLSQIVVTAG
ncbi:MAG TPA: methylenetetrahydrofolate--tRNA-(uracil(54)-C(5))-methyltransferase (FADH(2)-oxidizing) TrmFO [Blastocatellia bacterium]|nr:methylenetetrahydrofolate--tRNA-(uracil(54)-C(5))-methyltransferase (FADH(2)-oxidizing) TrmFO [Blastocatellia bacterium]HMV86188.1 methylenetetrahydrofolate--tRNA-(uracil(54)-C(5))-methyltransferase (FADH(2)-oxidizing) TrmFO [Blastocatellia bacterium]HMY76483.1 methylenetetrahydrofolate--tRNA-(uracil(54)-C(5))-methyltransferase (FADH(2)-oxidizing) TrmFO [Blastocatellia bacterium]HMZ18648.1 methylenetetrahydrofolate--tRNA-(uracil(54)-C(5))-methyltransferase (FADH(2)-oxidizing) TrmFO [Blastocat